jgi:hypothetical protein
MANEPTLWAIASKESMCPFKTDHRHELFAPQRSGKGFFRGDGRFECVPNVARICELAVQSEGHDCHGFNFCVDWLMPFCSYLSYGGIGWCGVSTSKFCFQNHIRIHRD